MNTYTLIRTGEVDLEFSGDMIASERNTAGTFEVHLYTTQGGQFVGWLRRTVVNRKGPAKDLARALATSEPSALLDWLRSDCHGVLGGVSKRAWDVFCDALNDDPRVSACRREHVS